MPDFPIVDAHVHLWDPDRFAMPWLANAPAIATRFEIEEYRAHSAGIDVAAFVYVEVDVAPVYQYLEACQAADYAQADPRLQGIVAAAPLEFGERARSHLAALQAIGPRIKGVRRLIQNETDPAFCLRPDFVRGVEILPEYGFTFDLCLYHHQLPSAIELVRRCPGTGFVLDHIGKPAIRDGLVDPWRQQIEELASLPNVVCKVSGLVTEADHANWTPDQLRPYVAHVLAAFGEDRVMFGSDWPVVLNAAPYRRWVETLEALTTDLSPQAERKLWADNARRFYRLPAATTA